MVKKKKSMYELWGKAKRKYRDGINATQNPKKSFDRIDMPLPRFIFDMSSIAPSNPKRPAEREIKIDLDEKLSSHKINGKSKKKAIPPILGTIFFSACVPMVKNSLARGEIKNFFSLIIICQIITASPQTNPIFKPNFVSSANELKNKDILSYSGAICNCFRDNNELRFSCFIFSHECHAV